MKVRYSEAASVDLAEILAYIANDNPAAAAAVLGRVKAVAARLALFPETGRRSDVDGVRVAPLVRFPYSIYYTIENGEVLILHIRHGARLVPAFHEPAPAFAR